MASSMPLSGLEIYQGCRTPSINSRFSESPGSPDLGSSSIAREFYQGFQSCREWLDFSQHFTNTEAELDNEGGSSGIDPRRKIPKIFRFWFTRPDSAVQHPPSAAGGPPCYGSVDIERITNHFRWPIAGGESLEKVYRGKLADGTKVAVKVLSSELWGSPNSFNQFKLLVEKFTGLEHNNLLRIFGYCFGESTNALIVEQLPGGNLTRFVDNSVRFSVNEPLTWVQRMQIALDVALGLEYLHHTCSPPMIHGSVKTTSILLDAKLNAKLAEPGYTIYSHFDKHRDVYDFGTVLWLLITGLTPSILKTSHLTEQNLLHKTWELISLSLDAITSLRFDTEVPAILIANASKFCYLPWRWGVRPSSLHADLPEGSLGGLFDSVSLAIKTAGACTFTNLYHRPAMTVVVNHLKCCLALAHREN